MNINMLIVGSDTAYAIETHYLLHFKKHSLINKVNLFPARSLFFEHQKKLKNKIAFKLGHKSIYDSINTQLLSECNRQPYHVALVFKGMEIFPETIKELKLKGIKLINYNPDSPFDFSGEGSGNKNITNSIHLYDLHFTYNFEILDRLKALGTQAILLPFGYDGSISFWETVTEKNKLCFIGYADEERTAIINHIASQGIQIDVYGPKWKTKHLSKNITVHDAVYGHAFHQVLRQYRIQLNLLRPHNGQAHNMRSFEIPGAGGIQLCKRTLDHQKYFKENENIFMFGSIKESVEKAKYLLLLSNQDANKIRQSAFNHCVNQHYSYFYRANDCIEKIRQIL